MLQGKPIKSITTFVIPMIFGSILQSMYGMADTAIVGKFIGDSALASVGSTSLIFSIMVSLTTNYMTGFSVIAGQRVGAKDPDGLKRVYVNGIMLITMISVLVGVGLFLFSDTLMDIMKTPMELRDEAGKYINVIYLGMPTTMLYSFFGEMLRATGNSKKPFLYLVIASCINIVLDLFFVCVLKIGVMGAGLATVISQAVSAILCFINLTRSSMYFRFTRKEMYFEKNIISSCAKIGLPACFLSAVICCGIFVLQVFTNSYGTEYIAANSSASRIFGIYTTPLYCYCSGLSVFVAQNFGAKQYDRIRTGVRSILFLLWSYSTVMIVISLLVSKYLISWIISDTPIVVEWANRITNINMCAHYALGFLVVTKSSLNAMGRPLMGTIQGFADVAIRIGVVMLGTKYFGFWGVAFGDGATWMIGAIIFVPMLIIEYRKIYKQYGFKML